MIPTNDIFSIYLVLYLSAVNFNIYNTHLIKINKGIYRTTSLILLK